MMKRTVLILFPDQVKKACLISNTPEPLKTHLQLNVSKLGFFDALRVATEDYSAGNTKEDDPMEVDVLLPEKGKAKENSGTGKKGRKKGKDCYNGKGYAESKVEHTRFNGECRNCGKHCHKAADCWYKPAATSLKAKGKGSGKSTSNVTEISESDTSKQVEETLPPKRIFASVEFFAKYVNAVCELEGCGPTIASPRLANSIS